LAFSAKQNNLFYFWNNQAHSWLMIAHGVPFPSHLDWNRECNSIFTDTCCYHVLPVQFYLDLSWELLFSECRNGQLVNKILEKINSLKNLSLGPHFWKLSFVTDWFWEPPHSWKVFVLNRKKYACWICGQLTAKTKITFMTSPES
jgi:hypothetical protein